MNDDHEWCTSKQKTYYRGYNFYTDRNLTHEIQTITMLNPLSLHYDYLRRTGTEIRHQDPSLLPDPRWRRQEPIRMFTLQFLIFRISFHVFETV